MNRFLFFLFLTNLLFADEYYNFDIIKEFIEFEEINTNGIKYLKFHKDQEIEIFKYNQHGQKIQKSKKKFIKSKDLNIYLEKINPDDRKYFNTLLERELCEASNYLIMLKVHHLFKKNIVKNFYSEKKVSENYEQRIIHELKRYIYQPFLFYIENINLVYLNFSDIKEQSAKLIFKKMSETISEKVENGKQYFYIPYDVLNQHIEKINIVFKTFIQNSDFLLNEIDKIQNKEVIMGKNRWSFIITENENVYDYEDLKKIE